ncbi:MAG: asparagine synthase (glutamine-hydrolyzing) [Patescibacteria group bacterium]|nr:asparagine synthase (glutamine-hydrolyzing) [Patescibacteria group bacterium]MDE1945926.1 asparagine synthase (glutamine-hydrolyzing) [Patescibacteria group bacterium]
MCGICGIIDSRVADKAGVNKKMTDALVHRGPDQDGYFSDASVGLGMRRLSIIDLSTGKQPIFSADGAKVIFFNGEIYNYKELRKDIEKEFSWTTEGDTEVILHLYEKYGEAMLPKLRGMFAFSIYDTKKKTIFIARDFFGIKPLYYWKQNGKILAFSSEIKSFLEIPGFAREVNDAAVFNYLSFQYNPLEETFFKNIFKLPPGHFLKISADTGAYEMRKYWAFSFAQDKELDERTKEKVFATVKDSVEHHMIADVPVGAFLSGGIDSSIIATLMQRTLDKNMGGKKVKTFTVGFDRLSEGMKSRQTSDFLGTDHTEITIGPDEYFATLPKAVWHFDEPVADPSAIGLYFVAREARKHVTVVLSGEGADELFGGYNIYLAPFAYRRLAWLPKSVTGFFVSLPFHFPGKNFLRRVHEKLSTWYIGNASVFKPREIASLWKRKPQEKFSLDTVYASVADLSDPTKMQYVDIHTWLVGDILAKADKMTMANSLELRVPFLDMQVAGLARTLPDSLKWRGDETKWLLREAFRGVIPEATRTRRKLGFPIPLAAWLKSNGAHVFDLVRKNAYVAAHFDMTAIERMIAEHESGAADHARKLYVLIMLALWYDTFMQ